MILVVGCDESEPGAPVQSVAVPAANTDSAESKIERGKYLVTITGCADCHTPFKMGEHGPEPDMARFMSGHPAALKMPAVAPLQGPWIAYTAVTNTAFAGPWGVTYAANLTSDRQTGMGIWTQEMFVTAMREGKHMGVSRPIMPPMPWKVFGQMTDNDLTAVFAYLQSIPAIENQVPEYQPPGATNDQPYEGD